LAGKTPVSIASKVDGIVFYKGFEENAFLCFLFDAVGFARLFAPRKFSSQSCEFPVDSASNQWQLAVNR